MDKCKDPKQNLKAINDELKKSVYEFNKASEKSEKLSDSEKRTLKSAADALLYEAEKENPDAEFLLKCIKCFTTSTPRDTEVWNKAKILIKNIMKNFKL